MPFNIIWDYGRHIYFMEHKSCISVQLLCPIIMLIRWVLHVEQELLLVRSTRVHSCCKLGSCCWSLVFWLLFLFYFILSIVLYCLFYFILAIVLFVFFNFILAIVLCLFFILAIVLCLYFILAIVQFVFILF